MAWVRIHDGAMTHPKIVEINDKAFRLWVWGLAYAQQHLTDGLIPFAALPARLKRAAEDLVTFRLWDATGPDGQVLAGGWQVHDYLEWNDSRTRVRERQSYAKRRLEDWRDKQAETRLQNAAPDDAMKRVAKRVANATTETLLTPNQTKPNQVKERTKTRPSVPADPRALEFLKWFIEEYKLQRNGAEYLVDWPKDAAIVKPMLAVTGLDRLKLRAQIMLSDKCDDDFVQKSDRGIGVLKVKFNWLSERLAAWEAKRKAAAV